MFFTEYFFENSTLVVAEELLGNFLVVKNNGVIYKGIITETEAYGGLEDDACHAFKGKTERNSILFKKAGTIYVHMNYGIHYLLNIITEKEGYPSGVLIRGVIPVEPLNNISQNRFLVNYSELSELQVKNLCNGPGKLCKAFDIDKRFNDTNIVNNEVELLKLDYGVGIQKNPDQTNKMVQRGKRVGVEYAKNAKYFDWNFKLVWSCLSI